MKYMFIGNPDAVFPILVKNAVYSLEVKMFLDMPFIVKLPAKRVVEGDDNNIVYLRCPYANWEAFYLNWLPIFMETE